MASIITNYKIKIVPNFVLLYQKVTVQFSVFSQSHFQDVISNPFF